MDQLFLRNWADLESLPLSIEQTIVPPTLLEPHQAYLDNRQIHFPLQLRRRQQGDFFYPTGMTGKKSISKYFKDEKYSQQQKENQWLLCKEQEVIWVVGKRCNRKFVCAPKVLKEFYLPLLNEKDFCLISSFLGKCGGGSNPCKMVT